MKKKASLKVADHLKEKLKSPKFRKEYEALSPEFELASALVKARAESGMTQQEVADAMGTAQAVVARLEGGKRPNIETLRRYAAAVGKTLRIQFV